MTHEVAVLMVVGVCRKPIQEDCWEKLEGTFLLTSMPYHVIFYIEGPSPGVNLHIKSATVSCIRSRESHVSCYWFCLQLLFLDKLLIICVRAYTLCTVYFE